MYGPILSLILACFFVLDVGLLLEELDAGLLLEELDAMSKH